MFHSLSPKHDDFYQGVDNKLRETTVGNTAVQQRPVE